MNSKVISPGLATSRVPRPVSVFPQRPWSLGHAQVTLWGMQCFFLFAALFLGWANPASGEIAGSPIALLGEFYGLRTKSLTEEFRYYLLYQMELRGTKTSALPSSFHKRLSALTFDNARRVPYEMAVFIFGTPSPSERDITDLFLTLRDSPEKLGEFLRGYIHRRLLNTILRSPASRSPWISLETKKRIADASRSPWISLKTKRRIAEGRSILKWKTLDAIFSGMGYTLRSGNSLDWFDGRRRR